MSHLYDAPETLLPSPSIDRVLEESEWHGELEQEAIDHDEAADTHVAGHDVLGSHDHHYGEGRAEYRVLAEVESGQGLTCLQGGSLVFLEVSVVSVSYFSLLKYLTVS